MRTTHQTRQPYAELFLRCAGEYVCDSPARPERFIKVMKRSRGGVASLTGMGLDDEGLELKNPVIAALGDSVTAGHFEGLDAILDPRRWFGEILRRADVSFEQIDAGALADPARMNELLTELGKKIPGDQGFPPAEITDSRHSYLEKFRQLLIDKYEQTSVSAINSGIAGDNLIMMDRRAYRDVIRYQPDLVLINGSLNWNDQMGSTAFYKELLTSLVVRIREQTEADIILLTPNGMVGDHHSEETLAERVQAIREAAGEQQVCLADVYAVWEAARDAGCPWEELLSNRINHPSIVGHEVYAMVLMKLFE